MLPNVSLASKEHIFELHFKHCTQAAITERWWNRHQIFKENGFEPKDFKGQESDELLASLLEDNRAQFGNSYQFEQSASGNKLLDKFLYMQDGGVKRTHESKETQGTASSSDLREKQVCDALAASSDTNLTLVKKENPKYEMFREKVSVLNSAKTSMEKAQTQASDLYFQMKASSDKATVAKAAEVRQALDAIDRDLSAVREVIANSKKVDASDDKLDAKVKQATELQNLCLTHVDGFKVMRRRCLAMLA